MRSTRRLLALLLALALGAAACTNGTGSQTTEDSESSESVGADSGDSSADEINTDASKEDLSLEGSTIGVAVVGTQHFWDREAFEGAVSEVERLGGTAVAVDGGRDNQVHAENHDTFLTQEVDAVVTILGDDAVEPKLEALQDAGIPVFGVDRSGEFVTNNSASDNYYAGSAAGRLMGDAIGATGNVVVFNAFSEVLGFCNDRYQTWKFALESAYSDITIVEELAEEFSNAPEDARKQTLDLLERYPEGELDAIHVACWDQPAIGVFEALKETGRTEIVISAIDAGPETMQLMMEEGSPWVVNVAQQPRLLGTTAAQNAAAFLAGDDILPTSYGQVFPISGPDQAEEVFKLLDY